MRPKIISCRHITRSVHYNEEKIAQQRAERLTAANMLKPLEQLSREDIQRRFERRMQLNERVDTSLHITLNFDPQDQLTNDRMREIVHSYMHEIGFIKQPWVAWRHHDAGHPHCHIVATHVQWSGDPIDLYNIGQNQSERARLKIERDFHLVTSEMKQQQRERERQMHDPEAPHRLVYGQEPLTRALSKIVDYVAEKYHYTSIEEFNAALRLYNVEAYIGRPGTKLYDSHGLLYRALDENRHYIGRPLKASFFDSKPMLDNLEKKFAQNLSEKLEHKEHVEVYAMYYLLGKPDNIAKVHRDLNSEGIVLQLDQDRAGTVKQVTYVDVRNKVIIPGKELRTECGAEAIQQTLERHRLRLAFEETPEYKQRQGLRQGPRLRIG